MKFRIHPLFFALALLLVLFGQAQAFLWAFAAVCLHEAGHTLAAKARGYAVTGLVLLPFGAAMSANDELDGTSSVIVGLAGPAVNLFFAVATVGLWWFIPAVYPYTKYFLYANLSIGLFNLLPVYPLDGSRVVLGLAKNRLKAVKGLQAGGVAVSAAMFAVFVAGIFFGVYAFTFGVAALFLFYGATCASKEESYRSVLAATAKNYGSGVAEKRVYVSQDAPLARLFHHIDRRSVTVFEVVEDVADNVIPAAPRVLYSLSEEELRALAAGGRLSATVREARERGGATESRTRPTAGCSVARGKPDGAAHTAKRRAHKRNKHTSSHS